jgi:hypothetical protein
MSLDCFNQLIGQLAQEVGLPEMKADEDGYCCIQLDGQYTVHLQFEPDEGEVLFFGTVGTLDPDLALPTCKLLLEANMLWLETGGATLALQSGENSIYLQQRLSALTEWPRFSEVLSRFVDQMAAWAKRLEELPDHVQAEDSDDLVDEPLGESGEPKTQIRL